MKTRNIFLIVILLFGFNGCGIGSHTYEIFKKDNDSVLERGSTNMSYFVKYYEKKEYNNNQYIYIKNNFKRDISEKCVYGFIVNKDDPKQKAIGWKVLSGKEYCKQQQQWFFSF